MKNVKPFCVNFGAKLSKRIDTPDQKKKKKSIDTIIGYSFNISTFLTLLEIAAVISGAQNFIIVL